MTRRRLTPDELALWQKVAKQTERLNLETALPPSAPAKTSPIKRPVRPLEGSKPVSVVKPKEPSHDTLPSLTDRLAAAPLRMDRKAFGKMKRGKLSPEGKMDLHGMTLDRAHPVLTRFILSAQSSGKRLVLVITGKGRAGQDDGPIPMPRGILKHQVPRWLSMPPLAQAVLQVSEAHISHGGSGAYYVYLRRSR